MSMAEVGILQQWCEQFIPVLELGDLSRGILHNFVTLAGMEHGFLLARDLDTGDGGFTIRACAGLRMPSSSLRIDEASLAPLLHWEEPVVLSQLPPGSPERDAIKGLENVLHGWGERWERANIALCFPLVRQETTIAIICVGRLDTSDFIVHPTSVESLGSISKQALSFIENAQTFEKVCLSYRQMIEAFADAIDSRNPYARGHSRAVAYYSGLIARQMILPDRETETIEIAALCHDIGRLSISDEVLYKPPPLTASEMQTIRTYPVRGAEIIDQVGEFGTVAVIVRHHCEYYDGSGTPDGLTGEAIPVGARILAVAHRFCALIQPRSYRRPLSVVHGAIRRLQSESGVLLDPHITSTFMNALGCAEPQTSPGSLGGTTKG
ncbi:MAG: HD domain-containing protein [Armatimonadetes bacterium]|nr:HD domain-containing protein [Armatimonadota bacterium]